MVETLINWAGCGAGTASLKARLLHQLTAMREEVMYSIFLDLHKAHDTLDRDRCLYILELCGVGPWVCRILCAYWDSLWVVARAIGYYGE